MPRALTAAMALASALANWARSGSAAWPGQRHEQRAIERPEGAADLHHQRHAELVQSRRQIARRHRLRLGLRRLETALHVDAVIAIADRLVERRQLVARGNDPVRQRVDEKPMSLASMCPIPATGCRPIEEQRPDHRQLDLIAGTKIAVGRRQRDDPLLADRQMGWFWSPRCSTHSTCRWRCAAYWPSRSGYSVRSPTVLAPAGGRRREAIPPERD